MAEHQNGNGVDHDPIAVKGTLFERESKDMGEIKGLGHVVIREAQLAEIWPYLGADGEGPNSFSMRMLAASLEIDGSPISFEQLQTVGMRKLRKLQELMPEVQRVNGMGLIDERDDEGEAKNVETAGSEAAPGDSPSGTDS